MAIGLAAAAIGLGVAGTAASAGTKIAGGIMANNAADKNAQAVLDAAKIQTQSQEKMYNQTRSDQLPYLTGGAGALGRLDYLLGLPGQQSSTKAAYGAGFGPQGSAYVPSNGGAPVVGYGPPTSAPAAGQAPIQRGLPGKAAQLSDGGYAGQFFNTPGVKVTSQQQQNPISYSADPSYGSLMKDFSASDFQTDPGYAFRLSEGQKALDRSAAARGGLFSGETLKANDQYNQNFASNEYQNAYNRYQNNRTTKYNFLSNAAGGGQVAAGQLGQLGAQYAGNISGINMNAANTAAGLRTSGYGYLAKSVAGAGDDVGSTLGYYAGRI